MNGVTNMSAIVPFWTREPFGFTKPDAVRAIAGLRLASRNARGKGRRAKRRVAALRKERAA